MTTDTTHELQDKTLIPVDETPKGKEPTLVTKEPSPEDAPKTHTNEEVNRLIQLARMDRGREIKEVEVERDALKTQVSSKESELADVREERQRLQTQIEDLTSDDPQKFNIVKKDRELREQERKLEKDTVTLEANKKANKDRVELATTTLREIAIWETAGNYDGGSPVKLKDLCDLMEATSEEQIVAVAETLWAKKGKGTETSPLKPFTGRTSGGAEDLSGLSPRKKIERGLIEQSK